MINNMLYYGLAAAILYAGINWVADNPAQMRMIRKEMNQAVDEGWEKAQRIFEIATQ